MNVLHFMSYGMGLEDAALLINRLGAGLFFAISGFHKLFNRDRHNALVATLLECRVPFVGFNQWFVPLVEFFGGLAVMVGLLAPLASLGMLVILTVAIMTDGRKHLAAYMPLNRADLLCNILYLPEVLLGFMLGIVVVCGPGVYSLHTPVVWYWTG